MIQGSEFNYIDSARSIYRSAALESGSEYYTEQQRVAWSKYADQEEFYDFVYGDEFLGWIEEGELIGFCSFRTDGYIKGLYVRPDSQGKGIGRKLLSDCFKRLGSVDITVLASEISKGLFEGMGLKVLDIEVTKHNDVVFRRYIMGLRDN